MADRCGLSEVWIGGRFTAPREPALTADLLITQALDFNTLDPKEYEYVALRTIGFRARSRIHHRVRLS